MICLRRRWGVVGAAGFAVGLAVLATVRARAAEEAPAPRADRVAAVKHIMAGVHGPRCGAIAELLKGDGPKDDKAWSELALHAALLNESGHLLMENGRCPDNVWAEATATLRKGSAGVFEAAGRKELPAARERFQEVTNSCQSCHAKHKDKPAAQETRVATVRHLMAGINAPNCSGLGEALKNDGPKDDRAWQDLVRYASLLNEAGFLLTENQRCPDQTWKDAATGLREHSAQVAQAGGRKNLDDARIGFKGVTAACAQCHEAHKKPPA